MDGSVGNLRIKVPEIVAGQMKDAGLGRTHRLELWVTRIECLESIDVEAVTVQPGFDWIGFDTPDAVGSFDEGDALFGELTSDLDSLGVIRLDAEGDAVVLVDCCRDHRRLAFSFLLLRFLGCDGRGEESDREQGEEKVFHIWERYGALCK